SVLSGARDLAEHVLVEIAFCVAILHRYVVNHVYDSREQCRSRNGEARSSHLLRVAGYVGVERAEKWENVPANNREHFCRREVLKARPPEIFVRTAAAVFPFRKNAALDRLLQPIRFVFFKRVEIVQSADEKQVSYLLYDFERVRDSPGPKSIPNS